jgi:glycosyltransferase involved in cell wall biosynthesis
VSIKICMVTDTFWPRINGVSVSISTMTRALRTLGHEVTIVAPEYDHLPTRRGLVSGDDTPLEGVVRFPSHPLLFFPEDCVARYVGRQYRRQLDQIREIGFDIVHTHTPLALGILATYWQHKAPVPLVHTFHTLFQDFMPHYFPFRHMPPRAARTVARWFSVNAFHWYCNRCDCILAPSHQVAQVLESYYVRPPVEIVPSGIEIERFQRGQGAAIREAWGVGPEEKLLLFSGRVCFEKNVALLVQATAHVVRRDPTVKLAIVGQGPAEKALQKLTQQLDLASNVLFTGYQPYAEMANVYAAADLFVFSSQTETQGLVTVEAMASGTPVVAVRGPGTLDLLEGEVGGLLCDPDEQDMADKVLRLLDDPLIYAEKAAQARERAQQFSCLAMARRVSGIYQSLLARG